ncbi:MAG: PilZ domain-containing protein [Acidobacteriota bacterium]
MAIDLRTTTRYFIMKPLPALAGSIPVEMLDLSTKGARLALTTAVPVGTRLHMTIGYRSRTVTARATVLWCQIDQLLLGGNIDRYLSGIVFDELAPKVAELLDEMIAADLVIPIVDDRNADRFHLSVPLSGTFGPFTSVNVLDLSVNGACLAVSQRLPDGYSENLRFQIDEETVVDIAGTVVWCRSIEGVAGLRVGLCVLGEEETLRATIERLCVRDEARIDLDSLRRKFEILRAQTAAVGAEVRVAS